MNELQQLNQLMSDSAQDAIGYIKNISNEDIDFNEAGIQQLDSILTGLSQEHNVNPFDNKMLFTVSTMLGAFIGETFRNRLGGEWFMDKSNPDAPFIVLNYAGKSYPFASVCFEKIVNDPQTSVLKYYELALNNGASSG
ncbi:hypothetical protein PSECIP111951_00999 [Pseudoalteromonas holothuriae]|uniref:DUF3806 domain-containing protein n=1 Tax=Pseudoalteromonas holothuriae TaxID=2963714 RepID=A0A9W4VYX6_9GAMM|nr:MULTISPECIES: hypothetical protein [unclassified Pseudoalteromonas]CAH9054274.1 hypothetical protein PSECIP111951_00999 [Pseudoalteromonas sp. CIP111951]CAH9056940.1 hypothetical protein PSECIP111854_01895 [Pseudoalteromonas sp. CIP111854]